MTSRPFSHLHSSPIYKFCILIKFPTKKPPFSDLSTGQKIKITPEIIIKFPKISILKSSLFLKNLYHFPLCLFFSFNLNFTQFLYQKHPLNQYIYFPIYPFSLSFFLFFSLHALIHLAFYLSMNLSLILFLMSSLIFLLVLYLVFYEIQSIESGEGLASA